MSEYYVEGLQYGTDGLTHPFNEALNLAVESASYEKVARALIEKDSGDVRLIIVPSIIGVEIYEVTPITFDAAKMKYGA